MIGLSEQMINNPKEWPLWPYLPVKNRTLKSNRSIPGMPRFGLLRVTKGMTGGLQFSDNGSLQELDRITNWTETTVEKVLQDGWIVD